MACFTITGIVLFCFVASSFSTNSTEMKSRTVKIRPNRPGKYRGKCVEVIRGQTDIELQCGRRDIIYSIDVNSYNSTKCIDDFKKVCSGLQLSVLATTNYCYFDRSCEVKFNDSIPIVKTSDERCIGRRPSKLKLSYNCIGKGLVHYLFRYFSKRNRTLERTKDNGMLISHRRYPWNYPKGLTYELVLKPNNYTKTKLFISVPVMELNSFGDVVLITNYSHNSQGEDIVVKKTTKGKAVFIRPSAEPQTTVKFYTDKSIHSAKGFIICYCWEDEDTDLSNVDICSLLKNRRRKKKTSDGNPRSPRMMKIKGRKKRRHVKKQKPTKEKA